MRAKDISFDDGDIAHLIRERSTIEMLADELHHRGYDVYERHAHNVAPLDQIDLAAIEDWLRDHGYSVVDKRVTRDTQLAVDEAGMDFAKWMLLVKLVEMPPFSLTDAEQALNLLVDLLQPPSVREARSAKAALSE